MNREELDIEVDAIGEQLSNSKFDGLEERLLIAMKTTTILDDPHHVGHLNFLMGYYYQMVDQYTKSIHYYFKCIDIFTKQNEKRRVLTAYLNVGALLNNIGDTNGALNCFSKALKITDEEKKFYSRKAALLNNIALIHLNSDDYVTGINYLLDSLNIMIEENILHDIPNVTFNLATSYYVIGDINNSRKYTDLLHHYSMELESDNAKFFYKVMNNLHTFHDTKNLDSFLKGHKELSDAFNAFSIFDKLIMNQFYGRVLFNLEYYTEAKPILESVLEDATNMDIITFKSLARNCLSKIYAYENDYKKAYELSRLEISTYEEIQKQAFNANTYEFTRDYKSLKEKEYVDNLESQLSIFKLLAGIGEGITENLSIKSIYEYIASQINKIWDIDLFSLAIVNTKKNYMDCYSNSSKDGFNISSTSLDSNDSLASYCVLENREIIITDSIDDIEYRKRYPEHIVSLIKESDFNSIIFLPIISKRKVIGGISLQSKHNDYFNTRDIEVLRTLASYCSAAIANYRRHLHLHNMKDLDGLTSIYNRHALISHNSHLDANHSAVKLPLLIVMIDIDYFKQFNDGYGHLAGDKCIVKVTDFINKEVSALGGRLFRYGGDEFVIIAEQCTKTDASKLLESIQLSLYDKPIEHLYSKVSDKVTLSIGGIVIENISKTLDEYYDLVDKNLYHVKEQGRNAYRLTCAK